MAARWWGGRGAGTNKQATGTSRARSAAETGGLWCMPPLSALAPSSATSSGGIHHNTPESAAELAGELSVAFLYVLERLGPEERAAFLLRQVFDYDYPEIAAHLGKTEAACRQTVHRASERVQQARTRFDVPVSYTPLTLPT